MRLGFVLLTVVPIFFSSEGIVFWEEAGAMQKLTHSLKGFAISLEIVLFSKETSFFIKNFER